MREWISIDDMARLEGAPYMTIQKRLRRRCIALMNDPDDSRRKLAPVTALSPEARAKWLQEQLTVESSELKVNQSPAAGAHGENESPDKLPESASIGDHRSPLQLPARASLPQDLVQEKTSKEQSRAVARLQPSLPFAAPTKTDQARHNGLGAAPLKFRKEIERCLHLVTESSNGNWRTKIGKVVGGVIVRNNHDYRCGLAAENGVSISGLYAKLAIYRQIWRDPSIKKDDRFAKFVKAIVPKPRPGLTGHSFFDTEETGWMLLKLREFYLDPSKPTPRRAHELLLDEINRRQGAAGIEYAYPRPTLWQSRTALEKISRLKRLRREGREAIKTAAGHIPRHYNDEFAGDAWCIDEWEVNGSFFNENRMRQLISYGTHNPIAHVLSVIDERTTCILDWIVTWKTSLEEGAMILSERLIRKYWLPKRLIADRAGRFRRLARKRIVVESGNVLVEKLMGPLGLLGVRPRASEDKNPRANRIERMHLEYARRAGDFGVSYKPPLKKHEPRQIDEQVKLHLKNPAAGHLISIQKAEQIIAGWVEKINNAKTGAKGCNGLTRREAFEYFRPSAEEIESRRPAMQLIDLAFAERDKTTVRPGGMILLGDTYYSSIDLAGHAGQKVRTIRYRSDLSRLIVLLDDQEDVVTADLREEVGTNEPEKLAREVARLAHARKVLAGELMPREMPEDDPPVKPGGFGPQDDIPLPEMSSSEWMMSKGGRSRPAQRDGNPGGNPPAREAFPDSDATADRSLAQTIIPREFFTED